MSTNRWGLIGFPFEARAIKISPSESSLDFELITFGINDMWGRERRYCTATARRRPVESIDECGLFASVGLAQAVYKLRW